ncbi:MAG: hypothetical protein QY328_00480 [Anaerolineales bacterium]|nr:MAG: hypothetical protein QY328_00480 [Anaerolineales bacterium]
MKKKRMSKTELAKIAERTWVPTVLVGDGRPNWMLGIPDEKLAMTLASGTFIDPRIVEHDGITYNGVVGGMDIYRHDANDVSKGFPINKDHYIIILDPVNNNALLVNGPLKDNEHWLEKLPDLPEGITIIDSVED